MSSEKLIPKVEKDDVVLPELLAGGTAIVLQRHEKYIRDRSAENAGSITSEEAAMAKQRDLELFHKLFGSEDAENTFVLFVSSDTQYAGNGRRSLETGQVAQDAAIQALEERGLDPSKQIVNLSGDFNTNRTEETNQDIRTMKGLVEPKMFDNSPDFVKELGRLYNPAELQADIEAGKSDVLLSPQAFGAYEADEPAVKELREKHGAEGVNDILDRTKRSLSVLERYARVFHIRNPGKKLVIWATSHYDTISPLVKDATNTDFSEYLPVDYGAGVVINIPPDSEESMLVAQGKEVPLTLGRVAVK